MSVEEASTGIRSWAPAALARATWRSSRGLCVAWWGLVVVRGALPAALTIGLGALVRAVSAGRAVGPSLAVVAVAFALLSISGPVHTQVGAVLGDRTSGFLQAELTRACSGPPGIAHLERPGLAADLVSARDFDLGIIGPPISVSMGFVGAGLVELFGGVSQAFALATVQWWAALLIAPAWLSTHWLLRESSFFNQSDPEVQLEQRHADYAYRLAVEAGPAKEVRIFGLGGWVVDRFALRRGRLLDLQWSSVRLRQRSLLSVFAVLTITHAIVLVSLVRSALHGELGLGSVVVAAQGILGASALAVGGFTWALEAAAQPVRGVERLAARMAAEGALTAPTGPPVPTAGLPAREIRFRDVGFTYPSGGPAVYEHLDLTIPAGRSLAIVGRNGAGKTTLVKLLCRLYDPTSGAVEVDGHDLRSFDVAAWRERVAVVFQDFVRLELPLRDNLVPAAADHRVPIDDEALTKALVIAGADGLAELDQPVSKAYRGGTDLSGGQWQRVALARALAAVHLGAGVVVLDEPTAQLDVRGEAAIFERLLEATRGCTTILISHRFSTVRHADRICVLEHGAVVELGTHDELMAARGRYRTMFDLQAERFAAGAPSSDGEEVTLETLA
jgi:ABC-type multidrug transport system fused ATPase/permease subunit